MFRALTNKAQNVASKTLHGARRHAFEVAAAVAILGMGGFSYASGLTTLNVPAGLDAAALSTTATTILAPYWGAILSVSLFAFAIGIFIMVFKRRTTGALARK
jgi:hypothetical protein